MKKTLIILVFGALMAWWMTTGANAQPVAEWQSTSTMQSLGKMYAPPLTPIGATDVQRQATTTDENPTSRLGNIRKSDFGEGQDGGYQDPSYPIGDAWSLMAFAMLFAAAVAIKKSINVKNNQQS